MFMMKEWHRAEHDNSRGASAWLVLAQRQIRCAPCPVTSRQTWRVVTCQHASMPVFPGGCTVWVCGQAGSAPSRTVACQHRNGTILIG
jgi:hypothetical protein